jgi:hypothetical protein
MDFPYSIFVWHAPRTLTDKPFWQEELRADTQQWAIYAAGLLYQAGVPHQDTVRERSVITVVRQGKILLALPDEHTVELCEKQIVQYKELPPRSPFRVE